jgi:hypothetical protein
MIDDRKEVGGAALGAPPGTFWDSGLSKFASSAHGASRDEKMTLEKSQLNLTPYRSPKMKNTQNRKFLFRVINQIKGSVGKSP